MIKCDMCGRLGNQMFQYAACKSIQKKTNEKIIISIEHCTNDGLDFQLNQFNVSGFELVDKISLSLWKRFLVIIYKTLRKVFLKAHHNEIHYMNIYPIIMAPLFEKFGIYSICEGYYPFDFSKKNLYLDGQFESSAYFASIHDELVDEFTSINKVSDHNMTLISEILNSESVCVTIRRGDFLSEKNRKNYFLCDEEYFMKAIKKMRDIKPNCKFFFFSDDIEWVRTNLPVPEGSMFECGNDSVSEKLTLMAACKNFIISNSTFSWWAQFLSKNNNKIVISPSSWKPNDSTSVLIEDWWVKL